MHECWCLYIRPMVSCTEGFLCLQFLWVSQQGFLIETLNKVLLKSCAIHHRVRKQIDSSHPQTFQNPENHQDTQLRTQQKHTDEMGEFRLQKHGFLTLVDHLFCLFLHCFLSILFSHVQNCGIIHLGDFLGELIVVVRYIIDAVTVFTIILR